ncbi:MULTISPECIES: acyl-CoA dehydrogenase family protein [unclassified Cupriavidus]|uniref:acyl-CoA dehydrogenase family protein n=1 Tax=unclassified Cupriavidus TaxID=2640874 RepID=UPI001C0082B8|nr:MULTISPECIES: acyl-CoA dehydrogenase family protein [unclassified Cupriavidus]MCA3182717.1 acyl-CoA dehydrogenase [Cupriavidus sp.]MCA3188861.1 acyl-CoA dehydrogenase [Cupriavidus sp.]MCA3198581.1 acyl-CoA dehydrogenase [Cupriavidus sp.]MCA3201327.1 acyl-CoA dehydrogenase [Cupriavidus sp.]MCA3209807.1 acyl-CoA dehydrogenase [Cupriavidus sp.]
MDDIYANALETVLRDHCTPAVVRAIEAGDVPAASALWTQLDASGFADSLLPDAGLGLRDMLPLLWITGQYATPLPLGQTIFARAVLHAAGVAIPDGPISLASFGWQARTRVADGATAGWFLAQRAGRAWLVQRDAAGVPPTVMPTGAHRDLTVSIASTDAPASAFALPPGTLQIMGAALHAAQMAGAIARVFDLTLQYANDRVQFGRPVGKFQAIQHQVSVMAEQVAATRMAAQIAFQGDGWLPHRMHAAIAKFGASDAVASVTSMAHAVHGAIGITAEYDLQLYTRRLHAWRVADGSEQFWAREIGQSAIAANAGAVDTIRAWSGEVA